MNNEVDSFWEVTCSRMGERHKSLGETCCLNLQGFISLLSVTPQKTAVSVQCLQYNETIAVVARPGTNSETNPAVETSLHVTIQYTERNYC